MAYVFLGNILPHEFKKYFGIELTPEDYEWFKNNHQGNADIDKFKPNEWHCFDIPRTLVCGSRETMQEVIRRLSQYKMTSTLRVGVYD